MGACWSIRGGLQAKARGEYERNKLLRWLSWGKGLGSRLPETPRHPPCSLISFHPCDMSHELQSPAQALIAVLPPQPFLGFLSSADFLAFPFLLSSFRTVTSSPPAPPTPPRVLARTPWVGNAQHGCILADVLGQRWLAGCSGRESEHLWTSALAGRPNPSHTRQSRL